MLLSQAAVRAISSYKEFAKGALHATDEDADEASRALQVTVQQTFHDLQDEVPAAHLAGDRRGQSIAACYTILVEAPHWLRLLPRVPKLSLEATL